MIAGEVARQPGDGGNGPWIDIGQPCPLDDVHQPEGRQGARFPTRRQGMLQGETDDDACHRRLKVIARLHLGAGELAQDQQQGVRIDLALGCQGQNPLPYGGHSRHRSWMAPLDAVAESFEGLVVATRQPAALRSHIGNFRLVPDLGTGYPDAMQVIALRTLRQFWERHSQAETPIKVWYATASQADWASTADVKRQFGTAVDFVGDNRQIFDLGGNKYRLIVHASYTYKRVLVKFIGTHAEYDKINAEIV